MTMKFVGFRSFRLYPSSKVDPADRMFFNDNPKRHWRAREADRHEIASAYNPDSIDNSFPLTFVLAFPDGSTTTIPTWVNGLSPIEVACLNDDDIRQEVAEHGYGHLINLEAKHWGGQLQ